MNSPNKYFLLLIIIICLAACKKEHLQTPSGALPVSYISVVVDSDTVYYAGGVNSYVGSPGKIDVGTNRTFGYSIINSASTTNYFEVQINNYDDTLGDIHNDFNNTIHVGNYNYSYLLGGVNIFRTSHVIIKWINQSGILYSSSYYATGVQSPATFDISSVEDIYEAGLLYKKVTVAFDCKLFNPSLADTVYLKNGSAVLLFGGI